MALWPGDGCFSPRTQGYGDSRSLTDPWERLIHPGWKELQRQGRVEASHSLLCLGTATHPAASAPSPRAAGTTQPRALALHRPPRTFPPVGANTNPPLAALDACQAKLGSPETRPRAPLHPLAAPAQAAELQGTGALGTHTPAHVPSFPLAGGRDLRGFLRTETAAVQKHFRSWSFSRTRIGGAECRPVSPS